MSANAGAEYAERWGIIVFVDDSDDPKARLRRVVQARRAAIPPAEREGCGERMRGRAVELPEVRRAGCVFLYVSTQPEMPTHKLIEDLLARGVEVAVPVIEGRGVMTPSRIAGFDELAPDRFGIPTPVRPHAPRRAIDVVLAPCIAVAPDGRRLGFGGGYYDRFLAAHREVFVAALAYEAQVVDDIPTQPHDRRVDAVVTERRVLRTHWRTASGPS